MEVSPRLTLNYGLRYDYEGPLHNSLKNLSIFDPKLGFVFQGAGVNSLYQQDWKNVSPRVGFAFTPSGKGNTVVRGSFGLYFDQPVTSAFLNNHVSNNGAIGVQANPQAQILSLRRVREATHLLPANKYLRRAPRPPAQSTLPAARSLSIAISTLPM